MKSTTSSAFQAPSPKLGEGNIIIYTDGSSLGNPGPGGYGCVIVFQDENKVVELGAHASLTTNNKMELTAIMDALQYLKTQNTSVSAKIEIYTDSSYAINGITKWIFGWQKNNWITSTKSPVLNSEIWKPIGQLTQYFKNLSFHHVRGHAGVWGNERCDFIATAYAAKQPPQLFNGSLSNYDVRVLPDNSMATTSPQPSSRIASGTGSNSGEGGIQVSQKKKPSSKKSSSSEKAYSYVSVIGGDVKTHSNWDDCKARVHGKAAKYKKVYSAGEEAALKKEWGK